MNKKIHTDLVRAEDYSVEELRQSAFKESEHMSRELAVALLALKEYKDKLDDLRQLLEDKDAPVKVRYAAALGLGRIASPQALVILQTVKVKESFVKRGVTQAMNEAALRVLNIEAPDVGKPIRKTATQRATEFSGQLSAYRKGKEGEAIQFPNRKHFLSLKGKVTETVPVQAIEKDEAVKVVNDLRHFEPKLALRSEQAVGMRCGGRDLMLLLSPETGKKDGLHHFLKHKSAPGVVAVRYGVETKAWSPRYHLLTQPAREKNQIQLMLVNTNGRVNFAGMARVEGERAKFTLQAVDEPGVTPAEIVGVFEDGAVHFTQLRTETVSQPKLMPKVRSR